MLRVIIINEIKQNLLSLKLQLLFVIMSLTFVVGSIAFVYHYRATGAEYLNYTRKQQNELAQQAENNATEVAVTTRDYIFEPLQSFFIDNGKSRYIPNTIQFNAYNVFGYSVSRQEGNPYLTLSQELNWNFIISMILSFAILLLSFDSISGEKEVHTLALTLSNGVSRKVLLAGKYLSIVITGLFMALPGYILSLLVFTLSGLLVFHTSLVFEILGIVGVHILFIACIAALGLFCSVISRSSNVSLLVGLTLWAVFLVFSPNMAVFSAETLFGIPDSETVQTEVDAAQKAINDAAPEGSWSMNYNDPFYPRHELRAKNQTNLMQAEKRIKDQWYSDQFKQFQKASYMTYFSPISLLSEVSESITATGYPRFRKNWDDFHGFQTQFLAWFRNLDQQDQKSPHWYNPYEDCSTTREKVSLDEIPRYQEHLMTIPERLTGALPGIGLLILFSFVFFGISMMVFDRYDVR